MMTANLVTVVKSNMDAMTAEWAEEVSQCHILNTYTTFDKSEIEARGKAVFENLIKWLENGAKSHEVEEYFMQVGKTRLLEGFPLTEVHYAIYLTKKVFWNYVDWRDAITGQFESSRATQVMSVFNNYFDLGNFHIAQGYFNELLNQYGDDTLISKDELKNILIKGKKGLKEAEVDDFIWRPV